MTRQTLATAAALLAAVCTARAADSDNWPRFRGHDGLGISAATTVPAKWSDSNFNWKTPLPAGGHSSPVVWGERVFITSGGEVKDGADAKGIVLALKAADGKVLWRKEERVGAARMGACASSTPAVDAQALYVLWEGPKATLLTALDHDGKELWRRDFGPMRRTRGPGASPVAFGELVVFANECGSPGKPSSWVAVDRKSGQTRWELEREATNKDSYSTPCALSPGGRPPQLVFTSKAHGATGVDAASGKVVWEAKSAIPQRAVGSPFVAGDLVVANCGDQGKGTVVAVRLGGDPAAEPKVLYTVEPPQGCYVPTPLAVGDLLFVFSDGGQVSCARLATGQVLWSEKPAKGGYQGSPVCVNGKVYCMTAGGDVVVLAATEKYEPLAVNPLGEKSSATPAVAAGRMYLRTWSHLISIGGK
jgi:outer membrane protein assembly factor BamB